MNSNSRSTYPWILGIRGMASFTARSIHNLGHVARLSGQYTLRIIPVFSSDFCDFFTVRALHTVPDSTTAALELIRSQPSHYIVASIAGRKHLLAPRDILTIPRLNDVNVGDVISLSEIHELGSREYTVRGNPVLPTDKVKVEATVMEHTKGNMEFIFKKKRRKGYQKTITHKQPYTRLRIGDINIAVGPQS